MMVLPLFKTVFSQRVYFTNSNVKCMISKGTDSIKNNLFIGTAVFAAVFFLRDSNFNYSHFVLENAIYVVLCCTTILLNITNIIYGPVNTAVEIIIFYLLTIKS